MAFLKWLQEHPERLHEDTLLLIIVTTGGCIPLYQITYKKRVYNMINETAVYDLSDLSKKLKISVRTLREYVKAGRLKAKLIGRAYYVTESNLMAFLDPET
jgi:hypothetical protein